MKEYINKVELRGCIGCVRADERMGVARFTLATNRVYKDADNVPVIETTWHTVCVRKETADFALLEKGRTVHLSGFLRNHKYTDLNNNEATSVEIAATKCEVE